MSPQTGKRPSRTRCPECGFEVAPTDDCSLCGHALDGNADSE